MRARLAAPVEQVVQEINLLLRGWAGYFRYGNSAHAFDQIRRYAVMRLAFFSADRGLQVVATNAGFDSNAARGMNDETCRWTGDSRPFPSTTPGPTGENRPDSSDENGVLDLT